MLEWLERVVKRAATSSQIAARAQGVGQAAVIATLNAGRPVMLAGWVKA